MRTLGPAAEENTLRFAFAVEVATSEDADTVAALAVDAADQTADVPVVSKDPAVEDARYPGAARWCVRVFVYLAVRRVCFGRRG
jgi:hypothetical protein